MNFQVSLIEYNNNYYNREDSCFEEETESNAVKWKLRICYSGAEFQQFIRYFCKIYNLN